MNALGKSVTGLVRKNNEDTIYISPSDSLLNLYIVADGMGGHKAGEIASRYSVEIFTDFIKNRSDEQINTDNLLDTMVEGILLSNTKLYEKSKENELFDGMGTTFTCAAVEKDTLYIAHVGDSRAYMYRKGELKQLTRDHSFVMEMVKQGKLTLEEAHNHPNKNVITRAVGSEKTILVDTVIEKLEPKDKILICSDGLTNMVSDEKISEILNKDEGLETEIEKLIDTANNMGGIDNISAIIIDMR